MRAYEHAVLAAGTDFRSDRLWESYINWETELGNLAHVTAIYDRILGIPTQLYSHNFQRFRDHVQNNLPKHFLSEEEFIQLRTELANMGGLSGEEAAPTDDLPSGTEDLADPAKRVTEIENMRHRVTEARQEVFNHNEHEVSKRWTFEEGIKRPYFHVKALEKTQLSNWKEYLDFEIENGTPERVVVLFERCLIACALYEDFWIKYAKYLENYSIEGVRHVYKKACTIHLPKKPTLHLLWAGFEEQQGNIEEARGILKGLEEAGAGSGHGAAAPGQPGASPRQHGGGRLLKVQRSLEKARKVLLEAIERDKMSPKLYLNLLELEYSVEFLEDFGSDINTLVSAYEEHQKISEAHESTKRKAENGAQEPEPKKQRTEDPSMGTGQMVPDMQPNHSAYNYNYNWYQQYNYQNPWGYGQYYPPPPTIFPIIPEHAHALTRNAKKAFSLPSVERDRVRLKMQLFVRAQNTHTLHLTGQETVGDIKAHVQALEGLAVEDQVLLLSGTPLEDGAFLGHCGVSENCTLEVTGRLLGGKVHGSLARAGKVRGQTPKVDKQEKKKKKTGRAKRRIQYNRRFVNVVPTFGKKPTLKTPPNPLLSKDLEKCRF
ncbi:hypothetical protein SKAU_G00192620 [Synaphobranchus kaupii]|uniref:Ubiquitin-like domain-containing protein n=1 Tax=Synaphobranchus kaupii TaxID=118154 RepID=A0A9Q1IXF1_SYNKA|nr:hypothetical protein SKAU_G00192620 [Synaphobranchus kaupii]